MTRQRLQGADYHLAPRLTEYCVALVSSLPPLLNERFPAAALSSAVHTNKLAVCLGEGSHYQKHYDNSGGDDLRKLTVLIYLQTPAYTLADGGCFRMFPPHDPSRNAGDAAATLAEAGNEGATLLDGVDGDGHAFVDIAPIGGRLLAFWSDTMVHAVQPSFASPADDASHRWALTVWMHTDDARSIAHDPEAEARHFPGLQEADARAAAG